MIRLDKDSFCGIEDQESRGRRGWWWEMNEQSFTQNSKYGKRGGENGKTEFVKAKENETRATLLTFFFLCNFSKCQNYIKF